MRNSVKREIESPITNIGDEYSLKQGGET